jgi:hypothetical protein
LLVSVTRPEVVQLLGHDGFEPGWETSDALFGETLSMRRPLYSSGHSTGLPWWQMHVHGYDRTRRSELAAHFEPAPAEHLEEHLEQVGLDFNRGSAELMSLLDAGGIEYDRIGD